MRECRGSYTVWENCKFNSVHIVNVTLCFSWLLQTIRLLLQLLLRPELHQQHSDTSGPRGIMAGPKSQSCTLKQWHLVTELDPAGFTFFVALVLLQSLRFCSNDNSEGPWVRVGKRPAGVIWSCGVTTEDELCSATFRPHAASTDTHTALTMSCSTTVYLIGGKTGGFRCFLFAWFSFLPFEFSRVQLIVDLAFSWCFLFCFVFVWLQ